MCPSAGTLRPTRPARLVVSSKDRTAGLARRKEHELSDSGAYPAKPIPRLRRWIYIGIGSLSLTIGVIALFVPVLPTTIFLIIASWFFVRSSPYLHHKLITHPVLGPPLHRFMVTRAMPRRAKVMAIVTMWMGAATGYLLTRNAHILLHAAIV